MFIEYNDSLKNELEIFKKKVIKKGNERDVSEDPFSYYKNKKLYKSKLWVLIQENIIVASVIIKTQNYYVSGKIEEINFIKYPISLATFDKKYISSSIKLIQNIKLKFPKSYLLGMGGSNTKTAKIFSTFGYKIKDLPFYVKPLNLLNILTQNPYSLKYLKILSKLKISRSLSSLKFKDNSYEIKEIANFKKEDFKNRVPISSFELEKNDLQLNSLAPNEIKNFNKFIIYENKLNIGNCTLFVNQCLEHKYFGNLKIGVFLDLYIYKNCQNINKTIKSLNLKLKQKNIDILIFNCGSKEIISMLKKNKWISLKSQWAFGASPDLFKDINLEDLYLSRLDGDGPINLGVNYL